MHLFDMLGPWGPLGSWSYSLIVGRGLADLMVPVIEAGLPPLPPGARLVDLGAGAGRLTRQLAERHPDAWVLGIDQAPAMVRQARREAVALENLAFVLGDALALPLADRSVTRAVSVASIKHWPDPARGIAELFRALVPGGWLRLVEVDPRASRAAVTRFAGSWRLVPPGTGWILKLHFTRVVAAQSPQGEALLDLCHAVGFEDRELAPLPGLPFYAITARRPPTRLP